MPGIRGLRRVTHQGRVVHDWRRRTLWHGKRPVERPSGTQKASAACPERAAIGWSHAFRYEPDVARVLEQREVNFGG